jgi:UDP-2,3-diacylglucosamine pyrophosphatase LpxH
MSKYIDFISDLHIEINGNSEQDIIFYKKKTTDDILILGGDITCYRFFNPKRTDPEGRSQRKRFIKFLQTQCSHYKSILYIPGNHEYYGHFWEGADQLFQERIEKLDNRVIVMQNDTYTDEDVTIFGSTLWTDFDRGNPLTILDVENGLNDYRVIKAEEGSEQLLRGYMTQAAHARSVTALKKAYDIRDLSKKFIIATHHAPSMNSHSHKRFGQSSIMYGFISDCDELIRDREIDFWIHSHTHHNIDYMIKNTRVISSMYGYLAHDRSLLERKQRIGRIKI